MQQIFSNTTLTVNQLIEKIDTGELGLPELQRPFIWKDAKVRDLFDLHDALFRAAKANKITLDMSEHEGRFEGLPFNLAFVVRNKRA